MSAPPNFRTPRDKMVWMQNVLLNPKSFSVATEDDKIFQATNIMWRDGIRSADNATDEDQSIGYKEPILFKDYLSYFMADLQKEGVHLDEKSITEYFKEKEKMSKTLDEDASKAHDRIAAKYLELAKTVPNSDAATKYAKQAQKIKALAKVISTMDAEDDDAALEKNMYGDKAGKDEQKKDKK